MRGSQRGGEGERVGLAACHRLFGQQEVASRFCKRHRSCGSSLGKSAEQGLSDRRGSVHRQHRGCRGRRVQKRKLCIPEGIGYKFAHRPMKIAGGRIHPHLQEPIRQRIRWVLGDDMVFRSRDQAFLRRPRMDGPFDVAMTGTSPEGPDTRDARRYSRGVGRSRGSPCTL